MNAHNYYATCDPKAIDLQWTLGQLQQTYFGATRSMDELSEQVRNSLCFAAVRRDYLGEGFPSHKDRQVGFARVITDRISFGWLCDFFVAPEERGHGVGHRMLDIILEHHELKGVTMNLGTRDAHEFYRKFGFKEAAHMMRRPG